MEARGADEAYEFFSSSFEFIPRNERKKTRKFVAQLGQEDDASDVGCKLHYLLRGPREDILEGCSVPLLVFLHGQDCRGADIEKVASFVFPDTFLKRKCRSSSIKSKSLEVDEWLGTRVCQPSTTCLPDLRAVVLCAVCPKGSEWKNSLVCEALIALIHSLLCGEIWYRQVKIDRSRVYLTGVSMGGLGSWMMAAKYPEYFAAVVPICGGGHHVFAPLLNNKPFWFFHSKDDNVVGVEETDRIVEALRKVGNTKVRYTRYDESTEAASASWMIGHNCWTKSYSNSDLWNWLFDQQLLVAQN